MAKDFDVHMFESGGAYIAVAHNLGQFRGRTLSDLRGYVMSAAKQAWAEVGGDEGEIEFSISADLRLGRATCNACNGEGTVETDRVGAQFLSAGSFDWSARAKTLCGTCEGIGVAVPGFGVTQASVE